MLLSLAFFALLNYNDVAWGQGQSDDHTADFEFLRRYADRAADQACSYTSSLPHPMAIFAHIVLPQNAPFHFDSSSKLVQQFGLTTAIQPLPLDPKRLCGSLSMVASNISSYSNLLKNDGYLAVTIDRINQDLNVTMQSQGYSMAETHIHQFPQSLLESLADLSSALEHFLIDFVPDEVGGTFSVPANFTTLEDFVECVYVVTRSMCTFLKSFNIEVKTGSINSHQCHS